MLVADSTMLPTPFRPERAPCAWAQRCCSRGRPQAVRWTGRVLGAARQPGPAPPSRQTALCDDPAPPHMCYRRRRPSSNGGSLTADCRRAVCHCAPHLPHVAELGAPQVILTQVQPLQGVEGAQLPRELWALEAAALQRQAEESPLGVAQVGGRVAKVVVPLVAGCQRRRCTGVCVFVCV